MISQMTARARCSCSLLVAALLAIVLTLGWSRWSWGQEVNPTDTDYEACRAGAPAFLPVPKAPDETTAKWLPANPTARYALEGARPAGLAQWRILAVGDIMTNREVLWTASSQELEGLSPSQAYGWLFRHITPMIQSPDLAVGNLEFPVLPEAPPSGCKPFNGEPAYLDALKELGFDVLFTANNHALDQGVNGTQTTLEQLRQRDFLTLGVNPTGESWEEILYADIGGQPSLRLAFMNYTSGIVDDFPLRNVEHLLFGRNVNYAFFNENDRLAKKMFGLVAGTLFTSALIPNQEEFLSRVAANAKRAREGGASFVIAFMHWGRALAFYPDAPQRRLAKRMCEAGVDAVLAAGPHTIQPVELMQLDAVPRRECLVAYSLGNFVGAVQGLGTYGLALEITLARGEKGIYVQNYVPQIVRTDYYNRSDPEKPVMVDLKVDTLDAFLKQLPQTSAGQ
jgi:hypothetical protein